MLRLKPRSPAPPTARTDFSKAVALHGAVRRPPHVAYAHLLGVINTESSRFSPGQVVRVLDAGCGGGRLLAYLAEALRLFRPTLTYEFYGFDVHDRPSDDFGSVVQDLTERVPAVPWARRIIRIPAESGWPYSEGFFDIIVSNQVGEHLRDHGKFFGEIARCLAPQGFSVNLFPLKHVIMEWHVLVPYAHRIGNYDTLQAFIRLCSRFGVGSFRRKAKSRSRAEHCARQAEYVVKYTGYISHRDLLSVGKQHGLLMSMRYTKEFYLQKLRKIFSRSPLYEYARRRSLLGDWLLVFVLRYVSGVTVLVEKGDRYQASTSPGSSSHSSQP